MRRLREESGVVAIVMALVVCFVMLPLAALTVDIGMQRVLRRDMQSVADVVALDMARQINGRTQAVIKAASTWRGTLRDSVTRNIRLVNGMSGTHTVSTQQQQEDAIATVSNSDMVVTATMGTVDAAGNWSGTIPYPDVPNAVKVTATSAVGHSFTSGEGAATRSAIATSAQPSVCFSVGTRTLALDTSQSALSPVLDKILRVNLGVLDYDGIVGLKEVSVPIAGLMAALNVGTVDQLNSTNVSLGQFMLATADVLQASGDTASANILRAVKLGAPGLSIPLSKILNVTTAGPVSGLSAQANVLDLLTAAIVAANGQNSIAADIPGVASLKITEPPQVTCGANGATAHSAQVRFTLNPSLVTSTLNSTGLTDANVRLDVEVGAGTATVTSDISCVPEQLTMKVDTGAVSVLPPIAPAQGQVQAHITIGKFLDYIPGLGLILKLALMALGIDKVGIDVGVAADVAATSETRTVQFSPPPAAPPSLVVPQSGVGSALNLSAASVFLTTGQDGLVSLLAPVLNATLGALLTSVATPLVSLLNGVLTPVLTSLTNLLGLRLGIAEVNFDSPPNCSGVKLVG